MKDPFYRSPFKKLIRHALSGMGLEVVGRQIATRNLISHHLRFILDKYQIKAVIDVGANVGAYGFLLRADCKFSGRIYSFEPAQSSFKALQETSSNHAPWNVYQFAIGNENCIKTMNVMRAGTLNSFLEPKERSPDMTKIGTQPVEVKTLAYVRKLLIDDGLCPSEALLKLDTQGYDFEIINTNLADVRNFPAIQVEIAALELYEGAMHMGQFLSYLREIGFDPTGIFPVSTDDLGRVRDFDCIFVNRDLL